MENIAIIGTGAWGTALALSCMQTQRNITLLARCPDMAQEMDQTRVNSRYLPGISLSSRLTVTADWNCLNRMDLVLLATPAQATHDISEKLKQTPLRPTTPLVICAKGIDLVQLRLLSEVIKNYLPNPLAVLSGPSFAEEVARKLPTAVTIAAQTMPLAIEITQALRHPYFRCYGSKDMVGVQVGGALKNVLAIACGIVQGRNLGNNASAALITRGLAEMRRFGLALGSLSDTFAGLSGLGDLVLTSSSSQSRNFSLGFQLGQGASLDMILQSRHCVTEGVATAVAVYKLAQRHDVHMPICTAVYQLLHQSVAIDDIIGQILTKQSELEF